jgi:hypothetical protein
MRVCRVSDETEGVTIGPMTIRLRWRSPGPVGARAYDVADGKAPTPPDDVAMMGDLSALDASPDSDR